MLCVLSFLRMRRYRFLNIDAIFSEREWGVQFDNAGAVYPFVGEIINKRLPRWWWLRRAQPSSIHSG